MFIDTHCHLTVNSLKERLGIVLKEAVDSNVGSVFTMGTDFRSSNEALGIAKENDFVHCAIGLHPEECFNMDKSERSSFYENISKTLQKDNVVAVGEIGMDVSWVDFKIQESKTSVSREDSIKLQKEVLEKQLDIALDFKLPVVIHCRDSEKELFEILEKFTFNGGKGVLHSFTGNADFMLNFIKKGWLVSFNGIITFKNGGNVRDLLNLVPVENLLFETDAPFLAPEPFRGQICEPKHVVEVYKAASMIKNIDLGFLELKVKDNVERFFKIS